MVSYFLKPKSAESFTAAKIGFLLLFCQYSADLRINTKADL